MVVMNVFTRPASSSLRILKTEAVVVSLSRGPLEGKSACSIYQSLYLSAYQIVKDVFDIFSR